MGVSATQKVLVLGEPSGNGVLHMDLPHSCRESLLLSGTSDVSLLAS